MAPITDPSLPPCALNAASERTTACRQPLRNANGRRLLPRLKQIARASREGARGESTKRCGQRAAPNRRSCAFKQSGTRSVEIAAALASTMARRSLKVVAAVGPSPAFASVTSRAAPRAKTACEAKRARPPQSSAAKLWAQASAAATFARQTLLRLNSLQRQRSAKSLQPSLELSSGHSQPSTPCRPAQASSQAPASPYEAV